MSSTELPTADTQDLIVLEKTQPSPKSNFPAVFGSTFITIFLAELGDKTQVATLLMSAQSHQPWVVFAGAATALVATSLVGVLVGRWLCQNISPKTLEKATGGILLLVAALLVLDVVRM
ncbi:MAG: TMEM165/GDT1 family protein [Leptolyngbya sp. Prado105]|jgi:putative Ca2+/H+ antiporter (TMEM165/GDT1 family)|nr:TMEM165/GDT1 family protein [Leptolyngbya sp. Prado105]